MVYFTPTHEWVLINDGIACVGMTTYAISELGSIVFVQPPEVNAGLTAEEDAFVVESTKAACDIPSPVTGIVTEVNLALLQDPSLLNSDPMGKGWVYKMRPTGSLGCIDVSKLLTEHEYKKMCEL